MSLIHEALEKLEQEKRGKAKKPVPEILAETLSSPSGGISSDLNQEKKSLEESPKTIYWIGGAVVFLFVLGMVYLLAGSLKSVVPKTGFVAPSSSPTPLNSLTPSVGSPSTQGLFSLTGITQSGSELTAIVNNELVRVGDWVSGARVKEIKDREVSLEFRGQEIILSLY